MLSDFIMIKHHFDDEIVVYPIADVHFGALEHNEHEWGKFCRDISKTPNAYLLLNGDLVNNSVRNSIANPFNETVRPREQKRRMVEYLEPLKSRILAVTSGNHEARTTKEVDQDITADICCKLDLESVYRENIAFVKLAFGNRAYRNGSPEVSYMVAMTHGAGGGIYTGASINRNERFGGIICGLDALVVSHTHKPAITHPEQIVIDPRNETITRKPYVMVISESWMSFGGYAAKKMLLPAETCNPQRMYFTPDRNKKSIEVRW